MNNKTWIFVGGLVSGLVLALAFKLVFAPGGGGQHVSSAPAPVTPGGGGGPDRLKLAREIESLEDVVKKDPGNYLAWKELGDRYFDGGQPQPSVNAYRKALAIKGTDPNVWTDMGVMYRELKDYDQAVASFKKAMELGPAHPQSRLNLGVVYMHDLNDPAKAIQAWEEFLRIAPNDERAEQIRQSVAQLKSGAATAPTGAGPGAGAELDKAAQELQKTLNK